MRSMCQLRLFDTASDGEEREASFTLLLELVGNKWNE